MKRLLADPILRQEFGIALSNAAIGSMLAVVVGIAEALWWLGVLAAATTFAFAAVSDRRDVGLVPSIVLAGLFVLAFVGLWMAGQSVMDTVSLVILGTSVGFGGNRLVFGVIRPVPELRRERERAQNEE
jgi:4-hydroxybenzoate polyprenyltransferase